MDERLSALIYELKDNHSLTLEEYQYLIDHRSEEAAKLLADLAVTERKKVYGNSVFIRGLIEVGNICKNDCYY